MARALCRCSFDSQRGGPAINALPEEHCGKTAALPEGSADALLALKEEQLQRSVGSGG